MSHIEMGTEVIAEEKVLLREIAHVPHEVQMASRTVGAFTEAVIPVRVSLLRGDVIVAYVPQGREAVIRIGTPANARHDVDDGLGPKARDGGAADVLYGQDLVPNNAEDPAPLILIQDRPLRIVIYYDDCV